MPLLDKFLGPKQKASVTQDARVQVRTPDGKHFDIAGVGSGHLPFVFWRQDSSA